MVENTGNDRVGVSSNQSADVSRSPASEVRDIVRRALTACLATVDKATGYPYVSLVLVGCASDCSPVLLLSQLARHTRNLHADDRASLLFDGTQGTADPLAGGRTTLMGRIQPCGDEAATRRFLSRHPSAAGYAGFKDFGFFAMALERAHYIGGFGRIVELAGNDVLIDTSPARALLEAEPELLVEMNTQHADIVNEVAIVAGGQASATWSMVGVDPAGADFRTAQEATRVTFDKPVATPEDVRAKLMHLAHAERGASRK